MRSHVVTGLVGLALSAASAAAAAQEMQSAEAWCRDTGPHEQARTCDVREYTIASATVIIDAGQHGGVRVVGGPRTDT